MSLYKQIFITSINKAVNKARATGKLDLTNLAVYNLYKYYIDFTEGNSLFDEENSLLKNIISDLKYKYPQDICNYKYYVPLYGYTPEPNNLAPTVSGTNVSLLTEDSLFFQESDFTTSFADANNDGPGKVILYLTGIPGTFKYNNVEVSSTLQLNIEDVINLEYTRTDDLAFSETLPFRISDNNLSPLWTSIVNNTLDGTAVGNQPATVGDNTIIADNRAVTVLTLAMFTSELIPPYSDPEADLIDAIRLDEISLANLGTFYLNSVEVIEGQIITREDINAGLFTHEGPDQDTISSDNFGFSARDEGSLIWVS